MTKRLRGFLHAPNIMGDDPGGNPVRDHYYEAQTGDPDEPQIWAYTGRPGYGPGEVLNAASCNWVAGLIAGDTLVERVTRNVLDRFGGAA